ncbi:preprotein translocase subunit SecG [Aerosticca soli]|jgi:preprotein translocase subunit SecG|uniref:Protein-export membrane protein SecG n=1 Tax=Aerosticca soli TaxID=2010829 RepID=A0A2Z6E738_9GAMM|nr:preprotein translocase subunit SecG [Aerosticca soli]MDI3261224.1 preprotein translocase subunit SecG [Fulvimonas sp.]BBD80592.1 preprotein translocase subunit SecG [Aerosticca soli]
MFVIFSVFYILIAAAMIGLILIQRGAGADAGSGFGGGASATVFGARGSASFLTRATAVLATLFFLLSLGMGIYLGHSGAPQAALDSDLGVMSGLAKPPANAQNAQPAPAAGASAHAAGGTSEVPAAAASAPAGDVPAASRSSSKQ